MKKWFVMLLTLALCMLMGTAFAEDYRYSIEGDTLYVHAPLNTLPDGVYESIHVEKPGSLELLADEIVSKKVINYGTIKSGTFIGGVSNHKNIEGGTFYGDLTNHHDIEGGTFFGTVNCESNANIHGGEFHAAVNNREGSEISGGTFTNTSEVTNRAKGRIEAGTFAGKVFNGSGRTGGEDSYISGGTFAETSEVTIGRKSIISDNVTFKGKVYYLIVVKIDENQGGTVIARVEGMNVDTAMAGQTVCLTVVPEANYELSTLTVTDEDENNIHVALRKTGDFEYSFTMPAEVVYVPASFHECMKVPALPETGDSSAPLLWLAMGILSVTGIVLVRKKTYSR